jgi:hypothetical protein
LLDDDRDFLASIYCLLLFCCKFHNDTSISIVANPQANSKFVQAEDDLPT